MNTISNPLRQQPAPTTTNFYQANPSKTSTTMTSKQLQQYHQQAAAAAAMNDLLARRHYAQTISRATNFHLLNRYHQQQQQQLYQTIESPLSPQQQAVSQHKYATYSQRQAPVESLMSAIERQARLNKPLCRCRVMYLGSSVPHITKNGLHGIQEPLRHLYPDEQFIGGGGKITTDPAKTNVSHLSSDLGIDSWLSVWSNGLLLENVDEFGRDIKRFFSIESLHYCAAVRFFDASNLVKSADSVQPKEENNNNNNEGEATQKPEAAPKKSVVRFLPLDAPLFQCPGMIDAKHPPMFAAIMRRTSGIKVLECHAFICRRDAAANALVRCCTHAYADLLSARRMSSGSFADQTSYPGGYLSLGAATIARRGRHPHQSVAEPSRDDATIRRVGQKQRGAAGSGADNTSTIIRKSRRRLRSSSCSDDDDESPPTSTSCQLEESRQSGGATNQNSSGDDNYAIISRHQSRANSRLASVSSKPRSETTQQRGKQKRGSSKSLFDDFMPKEVKPSPHQQPQSAAAALSHSMDLLQLNQQQQQLQELNDSSSQRDDSIYSGGGQTATKRHSKSMQNLQMHQDNNNNNNRFKGSVSSRGSLLSANRLASISSRRRLHRSAAAKRSLQDIRSAAPLAQSADPMRGERPPINNGPQSVTDANNICPAPAETAAIYDKPTSVSASNFYEQIEARKSAGSRKRDRSRTRTQTRQQPAAVALNGSSHSTSTTRRMSSLLDVQQAPPLPPPLPVDHYLYAGPAGSLAHQFSPAPLPYAATMQPLEAAYYANALLKYPPSYCAPPMSMPLPLPLALPYDYYGQRYYANSARLPLSPVPLAQNNKQMTDRALRKRKQQQQQPPRSKSLATRFRCLSPPLNFITGHSPRQLPEEIRARNAISASLSPQPPATEQQLTASNGTTRATQDGPSIGELNVVSAKPGFIIHSSVNSTTDGNTTAPQQASKRLSWLKRISLTMSGANQPIGDQEPPPQTARAEPAERKQKRTSRLFGGSLTLGRSSQPQQKPLAVEP